MNARKPVTIAIAALVLIGGAATIGVASPGDAPGADDTPPKEAGPDETGQNDAPDETAQDDAAPDEAGGAAGANDNAGDAGPPSSLPEQVPGHVNAIHETISSFLDGGVDRLGDAATLGDAVSDIASGDAGSASESGDDAADAEIHGGAVPTA